MAKTSVVVRCGKCDWSGTATLSAKEEGRPITEWSCPNEDCQEVGTLNTSVYLSCSACGHEGGATLCPEEESLPIKKWACLECGEKGALSHCDRPVESSRNPHTDYFNRQEDDEAGYYRRRIGTGNRFFR